MYSFIVYGMSAWIWRLLAIAWAAGIWWLSDQPDLSSGLAYDFWLRKAAHVTVFAILTYLVVRALSPRPSRASLLIAVVIALSYAVLDEWHQTWVLGRTGTLRDVGIDALGIFLAAAARLWPRRLTS